MKNTDKNRRQINKKPLPPPKVIQPKEPVKVVPITAPPKVETPKPVESPKPTEPVKSDPMQAVIQGKQPVVAQQGPVPFNYNVFNSSNVSLGIYTSGGVKVRNVFSNKPRTTGTYPITWDGKDDDGNSLSSATYIAKIITSNVVYTWQQVIGNTSLDATGNGVHRGYHNFGVGISISGSNAYVCNAYSEGSPSISKFALSTPQRNIDIDPVNNTTPLTTLVATDSTKHYYAGYDSFSPGNTFVFAKLQSNDSDVTFSSGGTYSGIPNGKTYSTVSLLSTSNSYITGLALQKTGNYGFITRKGLGKLYVFNRSTGATVQTLTFTTPGAVTVDGSDNLWMVTGTNTISKYTVNSDGTLTSATLSVTGVTNPSGMTVSPDNSTIAIMDVDPAVQQVKGFSNSTGSSSWTHLSAGGNFTNANASNTRVYWDPALTTLIGLGTGISYAPDGSLWVSDMGSSRLLHFDSSRNYIEQIQALSTTYSTNVDLGNYNSVFGNHLGFTINYSLAISGSTGWTFTSNWGAQAGAVLGTWTDSGGTHTNQPLYDLQSAFKSIRTFNSSGVIKTFAFLVRKDHPNGYELVELQSSGVLRFTGVIKDWFIMDTNGSLITSDGGIDNDGNQFRNKSRGWLGTYDGSGNPAWSSTPEVLADISGFSTTAQLNLVSNTSPLREFITSDNQVVIFNRNASASRHLGAMPRNGNTLNWTHVNPTFSTYTGEFPSPDWHEIGNLINPSGVGSEALVVRKNIITGYHCESWKLGQTNKFNHYWSNGLVIGQFGTTRWDSPGIAQAGMAGNALTPQLIPDPQGSTDIMYLWHGDEGDHSGVHRWKISGLDSIQEQSITITYPNALLVPPTRPGINLMAGLTFGTNLIDGTAGWNRSAGELNTGTQKFNVFMGYESPDQNNPDIAMYFRFTASNQVETVTRTLSNSAALTSWIVDGSLSWNQSYPNDVPNNGSYVEVLDTLGKVIARLWLQGSSGNAQVMGNDKALINDVSANVSLIQQHMQYFTISAVGGNITFKYAGQTQTTATLMDGTANWAKAATLRFYYYQNNSGSASNDKYTACQDLWWLGTP